VVELSDYSAQFKIKKNVASKLKIIIFLEILLYIREVQYFMIFILLKASEIIQDSRLDSRLILTNCDHTQTYKLGPDLVKASGLALQGAASRRQYLGVLLPGQLDCALT
jgi:hypothetical protein